MRRRQPSVRVSGAPVTEVSLYGQNAAARIIYTLFHRSYLGDARGNIASANLFLHSQALCCNRLLQWNIFTLHDPVTLGVAEYIL